MKKTLIIFLSIALVFMSSCKKKTESPKVDFKEKVKEYAEVELKSDLSHLDEKQKQMLRLLFEAADIMDSLYWQQHFGQKADLISAIKDEDQKQFALINYGPWDKLDNENCFVEQFGKRPEGVCFYPKDMSKSEFEALKNPDKSSPYTVIRRAEDKHLLVVPYHVEYKAGLEKAATLLREAAKLDKSKAFCNYLNLRADALLKSDYFVSDMAWMDMKDNDVDFVCGPIESYDDQLFGSKTSFESFILIKDKHWSKKIDQFSKLLPKLQNSLPVENNYKSEKPGESSDLGVYDAIYYAGDCNSGSKTIAINLPNDEKVQAAKGTRKLQLKNSMKAKFDKILMPISEVLIDSSQMKHIKFNAFFENVMFHEVAHGLGMKQTVTRKGTIRETLKENYASIEECKADIVGLYLVTKLYEMKQLTDGNLADNYLTFIAGIFRSVRFGASSAHGKANMIEFNYMLNHNVLQKGSDGKYIVNIDKMREAVKSLSTLVLTIEGDGNYDKAKSLIVSDGEIKDQLKADLELVKKAKIPRDIRLVQGMKVLGI